MSTVTRSTDTAEISALYLDNSGYEEDASTTMAAAFITVCTAMLRRGISTIDHDGTRTEFSPKDLRELIADARRFVNRASANRVKHPSFEDFRS